MEIRYQDTSTSPSNSSIQTNGNQSLAAEIQYSEHSDSALLKIVVCPYNDTSQDQSVYLTVLSGDLEDSHKWLIINVEETGTDVNCTEETSPEVIPESQITPEGVTSESQVTSTSESWETSEGVISESRETFAPAAVTGALGANGNSTVKCDQETILIISAVAATIILILMALVGVLSICVYQLYKSRQKHEQDSDPNLSGIRIIRQE